MLHVLSIWSIDFGKTQAGSGPYSLFAEAQEPSIISNSCLDGKLRFRSGKGTETTVRN